MLLILTLVALVLVFRKIAVLKQRNNELEEKEKEVVKQMQLTEQFTVLAASIGGPLPIQMPISTFNSQDPLGDLSKTYDRNQKFISFYWIVFFMIIALAVFKILFPWLQLLGVLGPEKFFHMLSL